jgi:hypothetical protein
MTASFRKRFPGFQLALIEKAFGLEKVRNYPVLQEWLKHKKDLNEAEKQTLAMLRAKLEEYLDYWNEYELKVHFITRIVEMADYQHPPDYAYFLERPIQAQINDIDITCIPDVLIAQGKKMPETPYFCLHEYKKQRTETDPLGQVLVQMLAAQAVNQNPHQPVYGCYVSGQLWSFVALHGRNYGATRPFLATEEDDVQEILTILKALKPRIEAIIQANTQVNSLKPA